MSTVDPRLMQDKPGVGGLVRSMGRKARSGDLGMLPVTVGLVVVWAIFYSQNSNFLTALNLTNLMLQVAAVGTISVGIFLVLLLGEIDLSVGSVSGLCASAMAVLTTRHGVDPVLAIVLAIALGALVGTVQGFFFAKLGVPAFVVTLAGLIGWQGLQLRVLGSTGTINIPDNAISKLANTYLPNWAGWVVALALLTIVAANQLFNISSRRKAGLPSGGMLRTIVVVAFLACALVAAVLVFNHNRGVPLAVIIFVGFVILFDVVTQRTRYGRHIYAVGGNAEAARRAGISVTAIRMSVYSLAGAMAACGGILAASRLFAVNQSSGGSDVLLNAIAAAVIGGTSLFGGRGRAFSVLLGMMVIGSISNGLDLLGKASSTKLMITGAVLLAAVTLDSIARRGRKA